MAVTFTRYAQGSYNPATDTSALTTSTITGTAVRIPGNPHRYAQLGLVESKAPTLVFIPLYYGQTPEPGDIVTWESQDYTVRDVQAWGPDGVTLGCSVVVEL